MSMLTGDAERRLLREVAALRSRLAEASAEHMSRPDFPLEAPDDLGPGSAMHAVSPKALDASDRRLEALQAEAQLLQDSLAGQSLVTSVNILLCEIVLVFSSQTWSVS